jgi:hypothetical protein
LSLDASIQQYNIQIPPKLSAFSELSYLPVLSVPEGSQLDEIRRVGSAESPIKRIGRLEPNGELFSVCFIEIRRQKH